MQVVICTKAASRTTRCTAEENIHGQVEPFTKVNSRLKISMAKVKRLLLTAEFKRVFGKMINLEASDDMMI